VAEIRARDLTFAYDNADGPVLEKVNFTIPAGSMVAIVCPSGAGKTTLLHILPGLLNPQAGHIEGDGTPLGQANLGAWRSRIGAVMQDDYLLSGTLADTISFFAPQPNMTAIEGAARFALIHDDIARMPMAYHSLVSDMGVARSSGQRQRILLARALYRDPDVLFLDEGTANLGENSEAEIVRRLAAMPFTRIAISHRPALVEAAQIVLHVEGGKVTQENRASAAPFMENLSA